MDLNTIFVQIFCRKVCKIFEVVVYSRLVNANIDKAKYRLRSITRFNFPSPICIQVTPNYPGARDAPFGVRFF